MIATTKKRVRPMNTRRARRIRAGLYRAGLVELFHGFPMYMRVRDEHRGKLTPIGQRAFDRAQDRSERIMAGRVIEQLRITTEFAGIINRNFQEAR